MWPNGRTGWSKGEDMPNCREMSGDDFRIVAEAFGKAAALAQEAGFDGIQIHAGHGFLLSEFLSPFYNRRNDQYGGSVSSRARPLQEVACNIRNKVGDGFPVIGKDELGRLRHGGTYRG